jgi:hypothetical protein
MSGQADTRLRWWAVLADNSYMLHSFPAYGCGAFVPTKCPHCGSTAPIAVHVRTSGREILHTACSRIVGELRVR